MDFDQFNQNEEEDDEMNFEGGAEGFFGQFADEAANPDFVQKMDAVIFVIDCQKHLLNKLPEEDESQMGIVLRSMQSFLKTKIISNVNDQTGLVLYNVKQDNNPLKFQGINRVYPLDSPSAERIKQIPNLENDFSNKYGFSDNEVQLHEVLWLCNSEFKNLDKTKFDMRVFLFTSDDNPHSDNQQNRDQCIHHFKQLIDMDVTVEIFPLEKVQGTKFDLRKFYIDVLPLNLDEINDATLDTSNKIMEIQTRMRQKEYKKRTLNRVLLELGNNVKAGVKLYCHLNKAKKPLARKLHKESNKPLKKTTKQLCTETGQILYNEHIGTCFQIVGEKIPISKEEIQKIKEFDNPGMKLIGFKPMSKLKLYYNYKPSYFLYPDEQRVKGSSQLFHALITQMLAKDKIAIVRFTPRKGTQVRFCALLPQEESYNQNHFQTPPGFNLIYLPYADDLRSLKAKMPKEHTKMSKDLIDVAKLLATTLDLIDFDPRSFEDPALQKFYSHLQAHALKEEYPENPKDLLEPDEEGFERNQELLDMFKEYLKLESSTSNTNGKGKEAKKEAKGPIKKKNTGNLGTMVIEKNDPPKKQQKKGGKKGKMEEEKEEGNYQSEDSRDANDHYDLKDGFVVDDDFNEEEDYNGRRGRKGTKKGDSKNAERKKRQESQDDMDNDLNPNELDQIKANEIEMKIMEGELNSLKMDDLKFYLKKNNLSDKGRKKEDLVNRALNFIAEKNN